MGARTAAKLLDRFCRLEHDLDQDRDADRSCGEGGGDAVKPDAVIRLRDTRFEQQKESDVGERVEGVRNRWIRRLLVEGERVEEVAGRPRSEAPPSLRARQRVRRARARPGPDADDGQEDQRVVEPLVEEHPRTAARAGGGVHEKDRELGECNGEVRTNGARASLRVGPHGCGIGPRYLLLQSAGSRSRLFKRFFALTPGGRRLAAVAWR